jgi:hypothetical protein
LGVKTEFIRAPRGPNEAAELLVRDSRLDVPQVPAQQLDLLTAALMAIASMAIRPTESSQACIVSPCKTFPTRVRHVVGRRP